jgi:tRNA pseudouridine32 synthase / 23S rRNA pseudouridine746 synthase
MKTPHTVEEFSPKPERSRNFNRLTFKPPLPVRDGVSPSYIWLSPGPWITLLSFLVERFPNVSRDAWQLRMHRGDVVNADGARMDTESPYRPNDCIFYYREPEPETVIPFPEHILYQDEHILVADKPHFLPVIPSGRFLRETLLVRLKKRTGLEQLTPIHRIDRETAGLVVFSHNLRTRGAYQSLFQKREVEKVYHAVAANLDGVQFPFVYRSRLVEGQPFFRMTEADGEPNSETHIDIADRGESRSRYILRPVTGKKHQLRVHLAALGIPIINDAFYPDAQPCKGDDMSQPLQLLARAIAFQDPVTGTAHSFESNRELALTHE